MSQNRKIVQIVYQIFGFTGKSNQKIKKNLILTTFLLCQVKRKVERKVVLAGGDLRKIRKSEKKISSI